MTMMNSTVGKPLQSSILHILFGLVSVSMGVLGFLCFWGCDLDFVSLGCIVLAVGLAIDFTAHICYAYCRTGASSPGARLAQSLQVVGWPILQASLATCLGVLPLAFAPSYMVRTFFKTTFLVVLFGLLHGLVWLPQMLYTFDGTEKAEWTRRRRREVAGANRD